MQCLVGLDGDLVFLLDHALTRGAPAPVPGAEGLGRHGEERECCDEREQPDAQPEQTIEEERSGPAQQLGILLSHSPVLGGGLKEHQADGVHHRRPEGVEGLRLQHIDRGNQVQGEQHDSLHIDHHEPPAECRHQKEDRAEEEDLDHDERQERLHHKPEPQRDDAGVIGPGHEVAQQDSEDHAGEDHQGNHERAGPAAAQVGRFRNRTGEHELEGVLLKVAQNGGPEQGRDHHGSEGGELHENRAESIGAVQQHLTGADGSEIARRDREKRQKEPDGEVDVSGYALQPVLDFEQQEVK